MRQLAALALVLLAALGGFAIYTFGWRSNGGSGSDAKRARADAAVFLNSECASSEIKQCRIVSVEHLGGSAWKVRVESANGHSCINLDIAKFEVFYSPSQNVPDRFHGAGWLRC